MCTPTKSFVCTTVAQCLLLLAIFLESISIFAAEPAIVSDVDAVPFQQITIDNDAPLMPWTKIAGDFDGDGLTDIAIGGRQHMLVWYKAPTWHRSVIHVGGYDTVNGNAADIDGDGDLDIVMGGIVWFENPAPQGDPALLRWRRHPIGRAKMHDVEIGDLDGDGLPDVVSRNQSRFGRGDGNQFHIWQQVSPNRWSQRTIKCPHGEGIQLGDIDSDGDLDVIIAARWYENTGDLADGPWTEHFYTTQWIHGDVLVGLGDINGDGRTDLVLTPAELAGEYYRIAWYECPKGDVVAEWTEHVVDPKVEAVCHSLRLADIDGDGTTDIVTAEMDQGRDPDEVKVYFNSEQGHRWTKQVLSNHGSHGIVVADFDGDGDIDVMGGNHRSSSIEYWENQTKQPARKTLALDQWRRHLIDPKLPYNAVYVTCADLNGDGRSEIIAGNWWYDRSPTADGSWQRHEITSGSFNMTAAYDFDEDGDIDILGTRGQGSQPNCEFVLARGHGDGTFTLSETLLKTKGDFLQGVAVARFHQAGQLQVALSWHKQSDRVQMLTLPKQKSNEKAPWSWSEISNLSENEDLSAGDIDRDGDIDLLLGVHWLENPGESQENQEPKKWISHSLGTTTAGMADRNSLVDLDGDGRLDSVVGLENGTDLLWYQGPKDPKQPWPRKIIAQNVGGGFSVDVADMDHDGDVDVVLGEHRQKPNNRIILFENQDQARTWIPHVIDSGSHEEIDHHDGTQIFDIDGDGDLDVVSVGWYHAKVWLFENLAIDR